MEWAQYDSAFMFKFSMRPGTYAHSHFEDDVPEDLKSRRLTEIIELQNRLSKESNQRDVGTIVEVLVECTSKKSEDDLTEEAHKTRWSYYQERITKKEIT